MSDDRPDLAGRTGKAIASRIQATMDALGLNQTQFAKRCGITKASLNNYLGFIRQRPPKQTREPNRVQVRKMADATGCTPDWFLEGDKRGLRGDLLEIIYHGQPPLQPSFNAWSGPARQNGEMRQPKPRRRG
jgi:transcriptional regulator with XRE-family HTH domain